MASNQRRSHPALVDLDAPVQDDESHTSTHNFFPSGFSDDDSGEEGSECSTESVGNKTQDACENPPRRTDHDNDVDESFSAKKPPGSLFGASHQGYHDGAEASRCRQPCVLQEAGQFLQRTPDQSEDEENHESDDGTLNAIPKISGANIRQRMSSMSLMQDDQREEQAGQSDIHTLAYSSLLSDIASSYGGSPSPSDGNIEIPADIRRELINPYELRKNLDRQIPGTWVDVDQSGNYDPEEEARHFQAKKARAKEIKAKVKAKKKEKKPEKPKEKVQKLVVKLHFRAIGTVLNITDGEENWPDDWSDVDSEEERERAERRAFYRQNTPGLEPQEPILDPLEELDDLTGHPAARGCRGCRENDSDCSMVHGGTWPCAECTDSETACEPIISPTAGARCRRCNLEKLDFCSFEDYNQPPQTTCDQCRNACDIGDCEFHPIQGYRTPRIDLDDLLYGPSRKFVHCTNCRANGKRCSVKRKTDRPPCNQCKRAKIACTFYDIPSKSEVSSKHGKKTAATGVEKGESSKDGAGTNTSTFGSFFSLEELAALEDGEDMEIERVPTPEIEMEDTSGRRGTVTKINTSFAHPIQFNAVATNVADCNFCEMPSFGFVGHFERTIHVLRWSNGLGFTELQGGHHEESGATVMCQTCTIGRVQIVYCPEHDIQSIYDLDVGLDFHTAADDLMSATPRSDEMMHQLQRWCSMCFSLATHKCSTMQPSLFGAEGEDEDLIDGCGLRLCSTCEKDLREAFAGDCSTMAVAMDLKPKVKETDDHTDVQVARADVGFLRRDGLLIKHVESEMGHDDDEGRDEMIL